MVAKTPTTEKRMVAALNPNLIRETVKKVDKCMVRLQELQFTVVGGRKSVSGATLSPRSTQGYLHTSLRCKQESVSMKNAAARRSPPGKFQGSTQAQEWRRMSLTAMLLGETVVEILQASQFAKEVVAAVAADPKTPEISWRKRNKHHCESTELRARRAKEKQHLQRSRRSELGSPRLPGARSRISFKEKLQRSTPRPSVSAQRVSPKNRPWAKKAVLFPNPLFTAPSSNSPTSAVKHKFYNTRSPVITRTKPQTPHKFLVKSPPTSLKSQFWSKKAIPASAASSPAEKPAICKLRRCSFSPSKLANRLISPLKGRKNGNQNSSFGMMSGLKQRPGFHAPVRLASTKRIIGAPLNSINSLG